MTRFKGLSPVDVDRPGRSPISEGAGSRGLGHVWGGDHRGPPHTTGLAV